MFEWLTRFPVSTPLPDTAQLVARDIHEHMVLPQILRHPSPTLHVHDDLANTVLHRNVQREKGLLSDNAVRLQSMTQLETFHGFDQFAII